MPTLDEYLDDHRTRHEEQLIELLRIPSVSADSRHKEDVHRAAEWVAERFRLLGFTTEVVPTAGHPIVYAESPPVPGNRRAGLWPLRCPAARSAERVDHARRSSRPSGTATFMPAARPTTRGRCSRTCSAPKPGSRAAASCRCNLKFVDRRRRRSRQQEHRRLSRNAHRQDKLKCDVVVISDCQPIRPGHSRRSPMACGASRTSSCVTGPKQDLHSRHVWRRGNEPGQRAWRSCSPRSSTNDGRVTGPRLL